ncbi:type III-B CRISPR module RAMP protein Cmr6, partial [Candidatus Parcubacteria bacterium]
HYYTGQATILDAQGRCNECKFKPDDPNAHPPGDWENPVPVYFLAVKPGTTFSFPLAKRRADVADELLDLSREWLLGALCHLGTGAKTNAGYGAFKPIDAQVPKLPSQSRAVFETTLELVTPAFLAGANQQAEDCDLRSATMRGLLRWWWRTMHAGFLDVKTLRALEAAIWGDTNSGGAVRIELSQIKASPPALHSHPHEKRSGLRYVAYGMDEKSKGHRKQRYRLDPPAFWNLRLIARPTQFPNEADISQSKQQRVSLSAGRVLEQAKAALWLLCNYGGVGSKSRKGFGSLVAEQNDLTSLEDCQRIARNLRQHCSMDSTFSTTLAVSPSISDPDVQCTTISVGPTFPEEVLERIGRAYSAVASRFKHNADREGILQSPNKAAWGLPRKIHGPREDGPIRRKDGSYVQNSKTWRPPEWLDFPKRPLNVTPANARHASPIHIHVHKGSSGDFRVHLLA